LEYQLNDLQFQNKIVKEKIDIPTRDIVLNNDNGPFKRISTMPCSDRQSDTESECKRDNEDITVECVTVNVNHNNCTSNAEIEAVHVYDDTRSVRSISTAATIAPDVIKKRIKLALDKRERNQAKRALVKGEASAVTRIRRDNRATIKESTGIWGWE